MLFKVYSCKGYDWGIVVCFNKKILKFIGNSFVKLGLGKIDVV